MAFLTKMKWFPLALVGKLFIREAHLQVLKVRSVVFVCFDLQYGIL